jgi:hypothetical protein
MSDFVNWELSNRLYQIGYDEFFALFGNTFCYRNKNLTLANENAMRYFLDGGDEVIPAPTFSQIFEWFRKKHKIHAYVTRNTGINDSSKEVYCGVYHTIKKGNGPLNTTTSCDTFKDAELTVLKKLIEIVESKSEKDGNNNSN